MMYHDTHSNLVIPSEARDLAMGRSITQAFNTSSGQQHSSKFVINGRIREILRFAQDDRAVLRGATLTTERTT